MKKAAAPILGVSGSREASVQKIEPWALERGLLPLWRTSGKCADDPPRERGSEGFCLQLHENLRLLKP